MAMSLKPTNENITTVKNSSGVPRTWGEIQFELSLLCPFNPQYREIVIQL